MKIRPLAERIHQDLSNNGIVLGNDSLIYITQTLNEYLGESPNLGFMKVTNHVENTYLLNVRGIQNYDLITPEIQAALGIPTKCKTKIVSLDGSVSYIQETVTQLEDFITSQSDQN